MYINVAIILLKQHTRYDWIFSSIQITSLTRCTFVKLHFCIYSIFSIRTHFLCLCSRPYFFSKPAWWNCFKHFPCPIFTTIWPMQPPQMVLRAIFTGKEKSEQRDRCHGIARLISPVLRQPPRKTSKSLMLTSGNTVTLYRHGRRRRMRRWEGGKEEWSPDWDRAGGEREWGMEREQQKKNEKTIIQIYTRTQKQKNPQTPSPFSLSHPLSILKSFPS